MKDIPTAEEFLNQKPFINGMTRLDQITAMIEFTKLHVEQALREASEKAKTEYIEPDGCATGDYYDVNKDSILNSYPLTNIK